MGNIFYFAGIVFIIEAIRGILNVKKEINSYKAGYKLQVDPKTIADDPEKLKETMDELIGILKSKVVPSIVGLFALIWNIVGIFNYPESRLFVVNISIIILSSIVVGYNKKFRKIPVVVTFNTLSILVMSYILYSHFFITIQ